MEKSDLIKRLAAEDDKRIKKVYITDYGKEVLNKTIPILKLAIKQFQKDISESEIQQAISTIKKIQNNIFKEHSIQLWEK